MTLTLYHSGYSTGSQKGRLTLAEKGLRFNKEVPTTAVRIPSFLRVFLPTLRLVKHPVGFAKDTNQRTFRKGFCGKTDKGQGVSTPEIEESNHHLQMTVARIENARTEGPWGIGKQLTLVDLSLAPLINRMSDFGCLEFFKDATGRLTGWKDCKPVAVMTMHFTQARGSETGQNSSTQDCATGLAGSLQKALEAMLCGRKHAV